MDTFKNFVVGYTFAQSAHGLKEIVAISRISNSDGARDCVWFHGIDLVRSLLKSVDNWGTAGGLSRINLVAGIFDQTDFDQFLESPLRAFGRVVPPGDATTMCRGSFQPSCSATSKPWVLTPSE